MFLVVSATAIEADGLRKAFGRITALDGLSFRVPTGSTALRPDAGHARVCDLDVVDHATRVRRVIGLAGQFAAVDPNLTGREHLVLIGRLSRVGRRQAKARADELLNHTVVPAHDPNASARQFYTSENGNRGVYFRDPAGHLMELITRAQGEPT
jgi:ABC-type multidrug transport system ATPase subunit